MSGKCNVPTSFLVWFYSRMLLWACWCFFPVRSSWNVCWHTALRCQCLSWTQPCQPTSHWRTCHLFTLLFILPAIYLMLQNQKTLRLTFQLLFLIVLRMVRSYCGCFSHVIIGCLNLTILSRAEMMQF